MAEGTIRIKWVRSGIGFPRAQKRVVQSLGLRRLNHVVERPNTAQIRGLMARVPHLVAIVTDEPVPAWTATLEYAVFAPEEGKAVRSSGEPEARSEGSVTAATVPRDKPRPEEE